MFQRQNRLQLRVPKGIITVDIISINMSITCTSVMKKPKDNTKRYELRDIL